MPASDAIPIDTPSVVSEVRSLAWPRLRSASAERVAERHACPSVLWPTIVPSSMRDRAMGVRLRERRRRASP